MQYTANNEAILKQKLSFESVQTIIDKWNSESLVNGGSGNDDGVEREEQQQATIIIKKPKLTSKELLENDVVIHEEEIQRLWGGSGDSCIVSRISIRVRRESEITAIVKRVTGPSFRHSRTDASKALIKMTSYIVEMNFLMNFPTFLGCYFAKHDDCSTNARCPNFLLLNNNNNNENVGGECEYDDTKTASWKSILVLEDLKIAYPRHVADMKQEDVVKAMRWLVALHKCRLSKDNVKYLWRCGTYWSLDKRKEENDRMIRRWFEIYTDHLENSSDFFVSPHLGKRLKLAGRAIHHVLHKINPKQSAAFVMDIGDDYNSSDEETEEERETNNAALTRVLNVSSIQSNVLVCEETIDLLLQNNNQAPDESIFAKLVLLHGDFKSENLFFNNQTASCCDFQWAGLGVGVLDLVNFVACSLDDPTLEQVALNEYFHEFISPTKNTEKEKQLLWKQFIRYFNVAMLDYFRYVIGSGYMEASEMLFIPRLEEILNEIESYLPSRTKCVQGRYEYALKRYLMTNQVT